MIKEIVKNTEQLQKKCRTASAKEDLHIIKNLIDTANDANKPPETENDVQRGCCGLAANQIGYDKRIVIVSVGKDKWIPLINPMITFKSKERHESIEGCMSLDGERTVQRHDTIKVKFQQSNGKFSEFRCHDFLATVIQHEIDHLDGKLI
jgi:peptide deformylase